LDRREFRRLHGAPQLNRTRDALVPGPYTQEARAGWLEKLLTAQTTIRKNPDTLEALKDIELITSKELKEIRRLWVEKKHEIEDLLPKIYERATGETYTDVIDEAPVLDSNVLDILYRASAGDRLHYETLRNLLDVECQFRRGGAAIARRGLFRELHATIDSGYFKDRDDALEWAKAHDTATISAEESRRDFRVQTDSPVAARDAGDQLSGNLMDTTNVTESTNAF
jgi:DNA sulfur modification protein DndC